jgi:hypothetical protein
MSASVRNALRAEDVSLRDAIDQLSLRNASIDAVWKNGKDGAVRLQRKTCL